MPMGNKITLSSFAFEDFRLPVFVRDLSLAEDVFPSLNLSAQRTSSSLQARAAQLILEDFQLLVYGQN
jgi:hypothetical protein